MVGARIRKIGGMDSLSQLAAVPALASLIEEATGAINAVHRRPVNLRKVELTSSESTLRGARANVDLYRAGVTEEESISAYSVLAPGSVDATVRTFVRAPLQVLARIDALAGGPGRPEQGADRLSALAGLFATTKGGALLPAILHGELLRGGYFGRRSGTVARVAARVSAIGTGFDPRGLTVPETYLRRHREDYRRLAERFGSDEASIEEFLAFHVRAFIAGATEAEGIASAAS